MLHQSAPEARPDTGGWVKVNMPRAIGLTILARLGIHAFEHLPVLSFALPPDAAAESDSGLFGRACRAQHAAAVGVAQFQQPVGPHAGRGGDFQRGEDAVFLLQQQRAAGHARGDDRADLERVACQREAASHRVAAGVAQELAIAAEQQARTPLVEDGFGASLFDHPGARDLARDGWRGRHGGAGRERDDTGGCERAGVMDTSMAAWTERLTKAAVKGRDRPEKALPELAFDRVRGADCASPEPSAERRRTTVATRTLRQPNDNEESRMEQVQAKRFVDLSAEPDDASAAWCSAARCCATLGLAAFAASSTGSAFAQAVDRYAPDAPPVRYPNPM